MNYRRSGFNPKISEFILNMLKMLDQLSSFSSSNMNVTTNSTVTMEESMQQFRLANNKDTENDADGYNVPNKECGLANMAC